MYTKRTIFRSLMAAAFLAAAVSAHAVDFSVAAPTPGNYVAPTFSTTDVTSAYVTSGDIGGVQLSPSVVNMGSYLSVEGGGSADIDLSGSPSYSFAWGSPDTYNHLTVGFLDASGAAASTSIDGSWLNSYIGSANGSNANTVLFTLSAGAGEVLQSLHMSSDQNAFEVAVAAVPEPSTYALLFAGLLAIAFISRRRKI